MSLIPKNEIVGETATNPAPNRISQSFAVQAHRMSRLRSPVNTMLELSHYLLMAPLRLAVVMLPVPVMKAPIRDSSSGAGGWLRVSPSIVR